MAVLSTLKHHGSYDRTCLIYDNLCLYITPVNCFFGLSGFANLEYVFRGDGIWNKIINF